MRLTQAHLDFYKEQKTPTPTWAKQMLVDRKYPWSNTAHKTSIHELINSQTKYDRRLEAQNLCGLITRAKTLFTAPHRGIMQPQFYDLKAYLAHIAFTLCSTDSKRRKAYACKWYNKLYTRRK